MGGEPLAHERRDLVLVEHGGGIPQPRGRHLSDRRHDHTFRSGTPHWQGRGPGRISDPCKR
jgi:hypothetical protein